MVLAEYTGNIEKPFLIHLRTRSGVDFYWQNFYRAQTYTYNGQAYDYLPFFFPGLSSTLDLENTEATLTLPLDPIIISFLKVYDGFSRANLSILRLYPEDETRTPISFNMQISKPSRQFSAGKDGGPGEGRIEVILQLPFSAITSQIPNAYYSVVPSTTIIGAIPEHPRKGLRVNLG